MDYDRISDTDDQIRFFLQRWIAELLQDEDHLHLDAILDEATSIGMHSDQHPRILDALQALQTAEWVTEHALRRTSPPSDPYFALTDRGREGLQAGRKVLRIQSIRDRRHDGNQDKLSQYNIGLEVRVIRDLVDRYGEVRMSVIVDYFEEIGHDIEFERIDAARLELEMYGVIVATLRDKTIYYRSAYCGLPASAEQRFGSAR